MMRVYIAKSTVNFMMKNYFKIPWRNLIRHKQFTFLNLIGLATGLASALLIYLWVHDDLSIDRFHKNAGQLYQVMGNGPNADGEIVTSSYMPILLAKTLKDELPEVEDAASIKPPDEDQSPKGIITVHNTSIKARELFVTTNFFNLFSYGHVQEDKDKSFSNINNVLLSDELAIKLFHSTKNIVGKTITWDRGSGQSGNANGTYWELR